MNATRAFHTAQIANKQLPLKLQKKLTEQLISTTMPESNFIVVYLRRLSETKQARLTALMDKSVEGTLTRAEDTELKRLGVEVDEMLLLNSQALSRAIRPELFDKGGRPIKSRFRQVLSDSSSGSSKQPSRNVR